MATTLKDILGAMLNDTVRAQHDTNSYLNMVSDQYAQGGRLAGMKLPAATIGELNIKLNYAVTQGIEDKEETGVNSQGVDKAMRYICNEVSELLIKTMVQTIQHSQVDYREEYSFVDTLADNREFLRHLRRRFYALLMENKTELLNNEAKLNEDGVRQILFEAAEEQLLDHEDIHNLFFRHDAMGLRDLILQEFERVLRKDLDDIMRESTMQSFRQIQRFGSLNVEIDSERLAELPPSAIQTISITIIPPDNIKVTPSTPNSK